MRALAQALWRLGDALGVEYRFNTDVAGIETRGGRACGVTLASGEHLAASAVVFNGDVSALANGMLGPGVRRAARGVAPAKRSLSALTWCFLARPRGFTPDFHNVFFAADYPREFSQIFAQRDITERPTVYLCAQDRGPEGEGTDGGRTDGRERFLMLINAPADGDQRALPADPETLRTRATALLADCGLALEDSGDSAIATAPQDFAGLFPGSGGALYGRASHGMFASFARPGARSRVSGLYLAGGSVHPGPGVPMAAMSGRLAARALLAET
jgi:1-hydroxycarotenoid 3,4-desaturase